MVKRMKFWVDGFTYPLRVSQGRGGGTYKDKRLEFASPSLPSDTKYDNEQSQQRYLRAPKHTGAE